ncbi:MAG: hypothetical protein ACYC69_10045 [Thermodesulfovibrionales bacterium]
MPGISMNRTSPWAMLLIMLCLAVVVMVAGCGKKGPPTLRSLEKPAAPSALTAVHRGHEMTLFWNYPRDKEIAIHNFILLRASGQEFRKIAEPSRESRSFPDRDYSPGQAYHYKIAAQNHKGVFSSDSDILTVTPGHVPVPPAHLVFRVGSGSLQLEWKGPAGGVLYNVYKSREKGAYGLQPVNKTPLHSPTFDDELDLGKTVYYTVRSLTDSSIRDESLPSPEIAVDPHGFMPSPPQGLRAVLSPERTYLFWNEPPETWVTGYRIYKRLQGKDYLLIAETQIPAFIDHDLAQKRDYRIHAVGPFSEGVGAELTGIAPGGDNDQKP